MIDFKSEYKRAMNEVSPDPELLEKLKKMQNDPPAEKVSFFVKHKRAFMAAAACLILVIAAGAGMTLIRRPDADSAAPLSGNSSGVNIIDTYNEEQIQEDLDGAAAAETAVTTFAVTSTRMLEFNGDITESANEDDNMISDCTIEHLLNIIYGGYDSTGTPEQAFETDSAEKNSEAGSALTGSTVILSDYSALQGGDVLFAYYADLEGYNGHKGTIFLFITNGENYALIKGTTEISDDKSFSLYVADAMPAFTVNGVYAIDSLDYQKVHDAFENTDENGAENGLPLIGILSPSSGSEVRTSTADENSAAVLQDIYSKVGS